MTETVARLTPAVGGLGLPEPVHDEQPPDLALAGGELPEQGGEQWPEIREQRVRVRDPR